ncbi:PEP-CTERM sorting domain-containing protein [Piscinibacter sp.]|uniref:PEP-CTERM sorting domain-containing protein n=1 Tax=Piscinibacter sp. TaxID=1903157 RepID=UPI002CEAF71C|nr:PEP-CTERM sorting domain-containing protein [Albitalea sp.]HUG24768.1 PEP-CTERM sorting domain-containing protein [Albitalea sp.]
MRVNKTLLTLNLVGLTLGIWSVPATAGYLQAQAGGSAFANANADPVDPAVSNFMETFQSGLRPVTGQINKTDGVEAEVRLTTGAANYSIGAAVGSLHVRVQTFARGERNNDRPEIPTIATGQTYAWAQWADEIIVTGTAGVPVSLEFSVLLSGQAGTSGTLGTGNSFDFRYLLPGSPMFSVVEDDAAGGVSHLHKQVIELLPGQYNIGSYLGLSANATARFNDDRYPTLASAGIDAGNTARYFIDVLSDQGGYYAASGTDLTSPILTSPIPEPQTWLMLAAGLAVLARRRVRR